jgi:hypothetical protein
MNTTRNTSSGKGTGYAFSGIVLFIVILFWIAGGQNSYSQGVGISEVAITPDTWSVLELRSTLRGFLAPRMTTAERNVLGLKPPAAGMLVYDTNTKSFWFYDGGWNAITSGSAFSSWNVVGNAGTTAGTHFLGTTDAQDVVFKANNTERARIFSSTGELKIGDATTGTLFSNKELVMRQDGDVYGSSILRLRNRNAENGAIFETTSVEYLVDFIFRTAYSGPATIQRNIRFEARPAYAKTGSPSFHFGGLVIDYPTFSVGDNYAAFNKNVRMGTYPDVTIPIPAPTAFLHFAAGTAAAGTAPLKFTAGTNLTAPEDGAVEYDGTNYYFTTGATRYTLARTLTATAALNFGNAATNTSLDLTIALPGAALGDAVILGIPSTSNDPNSDYSAWVSAAGTVTVRFNNYSAGNINPANGTFRVTVLR